jgi:hypothetical protein
MRPVVANRQQAIWNRQRVEKKIGKEESNLFFAYCRLFIAS